MYGMASFAQTCDVTRDQCCEADDICSPSSARKKIHVKGYVLSSAYPMQPMQAAHIASKSTLTALVSPSCTNAPGIPRCSLPRLQVVAGWSLEPNRL